MSHRCCAEKLGPTVEMGHQVLQVKAVMMRHAMHCIATTGRMARLGTQLSVTRAFLASARSAV